MSNRLSKRRARSLQPASFVESLESRRLLATFTVAALGDAAGPTLRAAVNLANQTPGADTIVFDPTIFPADTNTTIAPATEIVMSDPTGKTTIVGPGVGALTLTGNNGRRIFRVNSGEAEVSGMLITKGYSNGAGGAVAVFPNAAFTGRDLIFLSNISDFEGQAIFADNANLTIDRCKFVGYVPTGNYAVAAVGGTVDVRNSRFTGINAGGLYARNTTSVAVVGTTFEANSGSAVNVSTSNVATQFSLRDSTLEGNGSNLTGSALVIAGSASTSINVQMTNVTVAGNFSGGVNLSNTNATITHATIASNLSQSMAAGQRAGLTVGAGANVALRNTIVAGNTSPLGTPNLVTLKDIEGTITSSNNTLVSDPWNAGGISRGVNGNIVGDANGSASIAISDIFVRDIDNDGGIVRTIPLKWDGRAVNAGSAAFIAGNPFDARGEMFNRNHGGAPDMGAYEVQDYVAPAIASARFDADGVNSPGFPHRLSLQFSENIEASSFSVYDITITNTTTGQAVPKSSMVLGYDAIGSRSTLAFPGYANSVLPDGNYHLTIENSTFQDGMGIPNVGDYGFDFSVLAGDANHDRVVNFDDLVVLAQNYNTAGKTFGKGNFDYDREGRVDFNDLVLLAQRYNVSLGVSPSALLASVTPAAPTAVKRKRLTVE